MLVGIHQPHYLPWLRYFEKIARCDVFIVLDNIQYSKNGWQNRNKIRTTQGTALLTVPVRAHLGDTLDLVAIDESSPWQKKHWNTLSQSYGRSPYWSEFEAIMNPVFRNQWEYLAELNATMLTNFLRLLGIDTRIEYASRLNVPGTATERLVNLIQAVGGSAYYSGAYALDAYLDPEVLKAADIELVLQQWQAPVYPQMHGGEFVPDLSIVDLWMNCGTDSRAILLQTAE